MKEIEIYTDGACRGNPDGPGGYGVVMRYLDQEGKTHVKELSEGYLNTTNNRMELMGVLKALQALKNPCFIKLHTDSQYIVKAFNEGWLENWIKHNWKRGKSKEPVKNQDLWEKIVEAKASHTIQFIWVRGHNGHPDNERCDELATIVADNGPYQVDVK